VILHKILSFRSTGKTQTESILKNYKEKVIKQKNLRGTLNKMFTPSDNFDAKAQEKFMATYVKFKKAHDDQAKLINSLFFGRAGKEIESSTPETVTVLSTSKRKNNNYTA